MSKESLTVTEEQLSLFKEHVQLQREELAEQAQKNRADEAIELRRIAADVEVHTKNLDHAAKVITAQSTDRAQIRTFWDKQLQRLCRMFAITFILISVICVIAIFQKQAELVFEAIKTVATHLMALIAGIGADRFWVHRKKTGISSVDQKPE